MTPEEELLAIRHDWYPPEVIKEIKDNVRRETAKELKEIIIPWLEEEGFICLQRCSDCQEVLKGFDKKLGLTDSLKQSDKKVEK